MEERKGQVPRKRGRVAQETEGGRIVLALTRMMGVYSKPPIVMTLHEICV